MLFQYLKSICLIFIPKGRVVFKENYLGFLLTTTFGSSATLVAVMYLKKKNWGGATSSIHF